jgi:DNA-binding protein H-NS
MSSGAPLSEAIQAYLSEEKIMASYKELKAKAEELLRQAEDARKAEIAAVVSEIKARMAEFNLTLADLRDGPRKAGRKTSTVAPKYRDPDSGQTWSGRGKEPKWLAAHLKKGRKKEDFRI